MTPEQRSQRGKLGAHALHAKVEDPVAHTKPARDGFMAKFERQVDPDGVLDPAERARRAKHAMKAHMTKLNMASAAARKRKKAA